MSSGSDSDEEYVPGVPEQLSEEESADEETDKQYDHEQEQKSQKRKAADEKKGKKRRKTQKSEPEVELVREEEASINPEDEKKKEDDLWAKFLEGTDTKPKPKEVPVTKAAEVPKTEVTKKDVKEEDKARERRIFEFAGETIVVENNIIKEKIKTSDASASKPSTPLAPSRKSAGGISDLLGQLNKNTKLSTLEKSKLDWETYKKEEGVEDEIQSVNKGKQGYLERQDFLERADLRQYELEREARLTRRSNR